MPITEIGIDLGSSNIVVGVKGRGIVASEASLVAYDKEADRILAFGEEARQLMERDHGNAVAIRPLKGGMISDYPVTEQMLRYFIQKAVGRRALRKPLINICVPSGVTEVERRAVEEAAYQAGAREVTMVEETVAAAIGAGIDITKPVGNMIVDIGGGTTDIAIISIGAPVVEATVPVGGDRFNEAIIRSIRRTHSLYVGDGQAEEIKQKIGTVYARPNPTAIQVTGRNVITGLPKTVAVSSDEVRRALSDAAAEIVDNVHSVLEKTPPELSADIAGRGIVLAGGGARLSGFEELITDRCGINAMVCEDPEYAVALGAMVYNDVMERLPVSEG